MTTQEFATTLKTKYPEYSQIPDDTLVTSVVQKYPVYRDQISDFGMTKEQRDNVGKSDFIIAVNKRADKMNEISNTDFGGNKAYNAVAGGARQIANMAGGVYDVAKATPVVGGVISAGENIVGGAVGLAGKAIADSTLGKTVSAVSDKLMQNKDFQNAANIVKESVSNKLAQPNIQEGIQATGDLLSGIGTITGAAEAPKLIGDIVKTTANATGKVLTKGGGKLFEATIPVGKVEAGIVQNYKANNPFWKRVGDFLTGAEAKGAPQTAGKTALENGLWGRKSDMGAQANRAQKKIWNDIIGPALKSSDQQITMSDFFDNVEKKIIKDNPEIGRQNDLLEALKHVRENYKDIPTTTAETLQGYKEGWAKFVPQKAYQGKDIAGSLNDVNNMLAGEARTTIYSTLKDPAIRQAYLDYGNLKGLEEMGVVSRTGAKLKGGAGSFMSEVVSQALTPVGSVAGQVIYRTGKGLEFIGKKGAKTLGDLLDITKRTVKSSAPLVAGKKLTRNMSNKDTQ